MRHRTSWHRHITPAVLALAFLTVPEIRHLLVAVFDPPATPLDR